MQLLVIEDDRDFYEMIRLYIPSFTNDAFQNILYASTLNEARKILRTESPECILFDVHLPDGVALTDAIAWLRMKQSELIGMTGQRKTPTLYEAAISAGIIAFIKKDERFLTELEEALQKALVKIGNARQSDYFFQHAHTTADNLQSQLEEATRKGELLPPEALETSLLNDSQNDDSQNDSQNDDSQGDTGILGFVIRNEGKKQTVIVRSDGISHLEAADGKVIIVQQNGTEYRVSASLTALVAELPRHSFVRCHASYIVNMNVITKYNAHELQLQNGEIIPVSRTYRDATRTAIEKFFSIQPRKHSL